MSGEPTQVDAAKEAAAQEAAFLHAFANARDTVMPAEKPASEAQAPAQAGDPGAEEQTDAAAEAADEKDELASLPPRARELFAELEQHLPTLRAVPKIVDRVSRAEGRLGDVNRRLQALPTPAPSAAPKIEAVEALRQDLPEVAAALDAIAESVRSKASEPPPPASTPPSAERGEEAPTELLDAEFPNWLEVAGTKEFKQWVDQQPPEYAAKIKATTNEGVMLAALTRFDAARTLKADAQAKAREEALRLTKQREARAASAVVPTGTRRAAASPPMTDEEAFAQGFARKRL